MQLIFIDFNLTDLAGDMLQGKDVVLDTGYRVLGSGCWVLDTGCWILGTGYWMLGTG